MRKITDKIVRGPAVEFENEDGAGEAGELETGRRYSGIDKLILVEAATRNTPRIASELGKEVQIRFLQFILGCMPVEMAALE